MGKKANVYMLSTITTKSFFICLQKWMGYPIQVPPDASIQKFKNCYKNQKEILWLSTQKPHIYSIITKFHGTASTFLFFIYLNLQDEI